MFVNVVTERVVAAELGKRVVRASAAGIAAAVSVRRGRSVVRISRIRILIVHILLVIAGCILLIHTVLSLLFTAHKFAVIHSFVVTHDEKQYSLNRQKRARKSEQKISARRKCLEKRGEQHYFQEDNTNSTQVST